MAVKSLFECAISGTYANSAVIPQPRSSASRRLWPARPAAICLPDPCGLGCDSHGVKVFSIKLLKSHTQTGSKRPSTTRVKMTVVRVRFMGAAPGV